MLGEALTDFEHYLSHVVNSRPWLFPILLCHRKPGRQLLWLWRSVEDVRVSTQQPSPCCLLSGRAETAVQVQRLRGGWGVRNTCVGSVLARPKWKPLAMSIIASFAIWLLEVLVDPEDT